MIGSYLFLTWIGSINWYFDHHSSLKDIPIDHLLEPLIFLFDFIDSYGIFMKFYVLLDSFFTLLSWIISTKLPSIFSSLLTSNGGYDIWSLEISSFLIRENSVWKLFSIMKISCFIISCTILSRSIKDNMI